MIIDATDLILGRMASFAAKQALLGEKIEVINCEKAYITGKKPQIKENYMHKWKRGTPIKGPFITRTAERIVKKTIKGMLPHKKEKGQNALDRVRCYRGVPEALAGQKTVTVESANIKKVQNLKYIQVSDLVKSLKFNQ